MTPPLTMPEAFQDRELTAAQAAQKVKPGQKDFVGTASVTPTTLVAALEGLARPPADVELSNFLVQGSCPLAARATTAISFNRFRTTSSA